MFLRSFFFGLFRFISYIGAYILGLTAGRRIIHLGAITHSIPMKNVMKSDEKVKRLWWRSAKDGSKTAYFRWRINGRDGWKKIGQLAPADAREAVKKLHRALELEAFNERFGFGSKCADVSTFGELFAAYDAYCAGIDIAATTVKNNKSSMALIVRRVKGASFDVKSARVSVFNEQLIRDFSARTIELRKAECEEDKLPVEDARKRLDSAQRTIKSTVQQARSLFAETALQSSAYAKLVLPDMTKVMKLIVGLSTLRTYEAPAADVVARIARDAAALKETDPGLWLAFNLEVNAGLRRGSARWARWDWFTVAEADAKGVPVVVDLRVGVAKGGQSVVRFDAGLYREMLALRPAGAEFVLPGKDGEERDEVLMNLVSWLKARGLDRRQPNHELRKIYGDRKYSEHGAEEAQRALGHSDPKLTSKVYAAARSRRALRVV